MTGTTKAHIKGDELVLTPHGDLDDAQVSGEWIKAKKVLEVEP